MKIFLIVLFLMVSSVFGADWVKKPQIVVDAKNHLQWQDSVEVAEYSDIWKMAKADCSSLTLLDYHDWRLPTQKELVSLAKSKEGKAKFTYLEEAIYWTSEEDKNDDFNIVTVFSGNGFVSSSDKCDKENFVCVLDLP